MVDRRVIHLKRSALAGVEAIRVFHDDAIGVEVFQVAGKRRVFHELAFSGMRCRPDYHCHFDTVEDAKQHRDAWLAVKRSAVASKHKRVLARRTASFRTKTLTPAVLPVNRCAS